MKRNRPHPVGLIVCLLGISALFAGCETFGRFESRKAAVDMKRVEVFRTNTKPAGKVQDIGAVSEEGTLAKQREIEARFVRKARESGADALIFEPVVKVGQEVSLFASADSYLFKATMVTYAR